MGTAALCGRAGGTRGASAGLCAAGVRFRPFLPDPAALGVVRRPAPRLLLRLRRRFLAFTGLSGVQPRVREPLRGFFLERGLRVPLDRSGFLLRPLLRRDLGDFCFGSAARLVGVTFGDSSTTATTHR